MSRDLRSRKSLRPLVAGPYIPDLPLGALQTIGNIASPFSQCFRRNLEPTPLGFEQSLAVPELKAKRPFRPSPNKEKSKCKLPGIFL